MTTNTKDWIGLDPHARGFIRNAQEVIGASNLRQTVRQIYYQLVSHYDLPNNRRTYQNVVKALVAARKRGIVSWASIEDGLRQPRVARTWRDPKALGADMLKDYRKGIWETQSRYVEIWLEKDALSDIFEDIVDDYGVILNVDRGHDSWSGLYYATQRYKSHMTAGRDVWIYYFGDHNPSGEDLKYSLIKRLAWFFGEDESILQTVRVAINLEDIAKYNLPADVTKGDDKRTESYRAVDSNIAVEVEALPVDVLETRIRSSIAHTLDIDALRQVYSEEEAERKQIRDVLSSL